MDEIVEMFEDVKALFSIQHQKNEVILRNIINNLLFKI